MKLRVVLVEPMYDGNVGSVEKAATSCAAFFEKLQLCYGES